MKFKEITVGVTKLVAQPNYENVKYTAEVTVSVEEGEDPNVVYDSALQFCKEKIVLEITRLEQRK